MSKDTSQGIFQAVLQFNIPDDALGRYATNMLVQRGEHEFFLTFFEAKAPIITDPTGPLPDHVRADYICRIIVAADRMPEFARVMQESVDKLRQLTKKEGE